MSLHRVIRVISGLNCGVILNGIIVELLISRR